MAQDKQPVRDKDLDPVPKIPRSWGMRWVWTDLFRISFLLIMLVMIVVMKDQCADGVSKFMGTFDAPPDAAGTPGLDPYAPIVPEGWELKSVDDIDLETMFPSNRDGGAPDTASADASSPAPTDRSQRQPRPSPPPAPRESSPTGR